MFSLWFRTICLITVVRLVYPFFSLCPFLFGNFPFRLEPMTRKSQQMPLSAGCGLSTTVNQYQPLWSTTNHYDTTNQPTNHQPKIYLQFVYPKINAVRTICLRSKFLPCKQNVFYVLESKLDPLIILEKFALSPGWTLDLVLPLLH